MESSLVVRLAAGLPERIARRIQLLLASAPDPQAVERYLDRLHQESPSAFERITSSPAALRCAVNVFSYSRFLSDAVLKKPERILEVSGSGSFYRVLSVEGYEERLFDFLGKERRDMPSALDLARFRRRQIFRIAMRDVDGCGGAGGGHRGALQPGRCDPGLYLSPHSWAPGGATRRAAHGRWRRVRVLGDFARQVGRQGA
jgi:hypothetical protein